MNTCGQPGGIETLIVLGANPVVSAAGAGQVTERLKALKHLIVIDFLPSETAQLATLVLPGSQWCEEEGTTTNLEGRVQRRRKAITAPGAAREDWRILCDLAHAAGRPQGFKYASFRDLQDEFFRATRGAVADYSGLSAERLDRASFQWPVPHAGSPGTPYAYAPTYPTPDRLATLHLPHLPPAGTSGLTLTTGRLGNQYQSGTQTRRNPALRAEATVQLHPETARDHGLRAGDRVTLRTAHGETTLPVTLSPGMRPDTVFVPFHWPGTANLLTSPDCLDPHSRMPAFKSTSVTVHPATVPARDGPERKDPSPARPPRPGW
ncbi:molybdopterin oxidoreductase family protein [Deinococcus hohokamensis]|uniref:Molybdopterin oxidoreductase family protein n=1 Tax=Deinococcus hohokamensis TaxID=309883 RepID=A0ABV9I8H6_9DEIO